MVLKLKDLEPIDDPKIIHRYLQYTIDLHEDILCFVKDDEFKFSSRLLTAPTEKLELKLEVPADQISPDNFLKLMNETTDRQINISFNTQDTLFVGRTRFKTVQPGQINVVLTPPLFKLQRRQALRFRPNAEAPCKIEIPADLHPLRETNLKLYDLSAGGFSILASEVEADFFVLGHAFEKWNLYFGGETFKFDSKVAARKQLTEPKDPKRPWKIGFKFTKISTRLEQLLAKEAYSYTQRIFARRI